MKQSLHCLSLCLLLLAIPVSATTIPVTDGLAQPIGAAPQVLIPAAGAIQGANGTFFRSDISIINFRSTPQSVELRWIPSVDNGGAAVVRIIQFTPSSGVRSENFAADILGVTGLGSILITGITGTSTPDAGARLYATARIWTQQPGTTGTTSQTFPTLPVGTLSTPGVAAILGLRRDTRYRLNVGVVNLDPINSQSFQIQDPTPAGEFPLILLVTLPPRTMQQVALPGDSDSSQVLVTNTTSSTTRSNLWTTYGSSVDNVTGDAWSELGIAGTP